MKITQRGNEVTFEGAICRNCKEDEDVHLEGKCPFEATTFVIMTDTEFRKEVDRLLETRRRFLQEGGNLEVKWTSRTFTV